MTATKGRRKQSYPSKAPASPDIVANYHHESNNEEQAHDFTTWSNKIKGKVFRCAINMLLLRCS